MQRRILSTTRVQHASGVPERGFTLVEMMMVIAILSLVMAVAVAGLVQMQQRNAAESSKVDTVQVTRDFVDQMVRDIHEVGYPPARALSGNPTCINNPNVSCGLISFSPTQIRYEGDLDGTGTVYQVWMQLQAPPSGHCPCTLQRGVVDKASALNGSVPTYFTEVTGVLNSGDGTGGALYPIVLPGSPNYSSYATIEVFDAYFNDGTKFVDPIGNYSCNDVLTCSAIRSLQISANVAPSFSDPNTKMYPVFSITSKARLNN